MAQFAYLNESARPEAEKVRAKVDEFYSRYPEGHRAALRNRLRSIDDVAHHSALFELALHELLLCVGCRIVAVEPPISGTNNKPDFLVEAPNRKRFYLEATIATGQSQATTGAQKRLDEVYKAIDAVSSPDFLLSVETVGKPSRSVPLNKLKGDIGRWLKGLDYDTIRVAWEAGEDPPTFTYDEHDLVLTISTIPRGSTRGEVGGRSIGAYTMPPVQVQPHEAITSAVKSKAGQYGRPGLPYIVAVNTMQDYSREINAIDALFGTPGVSIHHTADGLTSRETRDRDGVWMGRGGPTNTRVSAVLSTEGLTAWSLGQRQLRLILNPWAEKPLPECDLKVDKHELEGDVLRKRRGKSLREIYGLPENWPE